MSIEQRELVLERRMTYAFFPTPGNFKGCMIDEKTGKSNSDGMLWGYSSTVELFRLPEWWKETIASGQWSFGEWSPLGSRFSELLFLDVLGTATEQVRTYMFRRTSSSLDRALIIRDFVNLNSFESFLVTLPSISSEIFLDQEPILDQVCSVTNFSWYFGVFLSKLPLISSNSSKLTWYWRKSSVSSEDWIEGFIFIIQSHDLFLLWGKRVSINANIQSF